MQKFIVEFTGNVDYLIADQIRVALEKANLGRFAHINVQEQLQPATWKRGSYGDAVMRYSDSSKDDYYEPR